MKNAAFRLVAYSTIGFLALVALQMDPPASASPADRFSAINSSDPAPVWQTSADTLNRGETLSELFERMGLDGSNASDAIRASALDARRVPANLPVIVKTMHPDSLPSEIVLNLAIDRFVRLTRTDSGWVGKDETLPWEMDTVVVRGLVQSNLYAAMDSGASKVITARARNLLTESLASLYDYRVDMSRDLQVGDQFSVVFERLTGPGGVEKVGNILAASMTLSGRETQAYRFQASGMDGMYFDQSGRPMKSGFLRSPLAFTRITSNFGLRKHPVLGTWRNHAGTDYGAASGTPVRAIGDGSVIFAGWRGGYGNVIDVRHRNGFVSRYAHLRAFAKGIRSGMPVSRESTIGYVGMTGLVTGPHLHFELLVNGTQKNPRTLLANVQPERPIPAGEQPRFVLLQSRFTSALLTGMGIVRLVQNHPDSM